MYACTCHTQSSWPGLKHAQLQWRRSDCKCEAAALWLPVCMLAASSKLQHAVRKGVHDTCCAGVLHLPAAQHLMTQKATQAGSLVATAVGVQYSQNAEMR